MFPPSRRDHDNQNDCMDASTTSNALPQINVPPRFSSSLAVSVMGKKNPHHQRKGAQDNTTPDDAQQDQKAQSKRFRRSSSSISSAALSSLPFSHGPEDSTIHYRSNTTAPTTGTSKSQSSSFFSSNHSTSVAMPGPFDVICGRGNKSWNHTGNTYFRSFVQACAHKYGEAPTKSMRSQVITTIMDHIKSKGNGFIKQEEDGSGRWVQVDENLAREKCGQILRNVLSNRYKSSTKAKFFRRRKVVVDCGVNLHDILHSNRQVKEIMTDLKDKVDQQPYDLMDDEDAIELFTAANSNLLNVFKTDTRLVKTFENSLRSAHDTR